MHIEAAGLRKSFQVGKAVVPAVRGVDLSVAPGEIFGFLGPNGAGKTTTVRILSTLLPMDEGRASVAGADLRTRPGVVRGRIGLVAQNGGTWYEVSPREELVLQARLHGHTRREAGRLAASMIDGFGLGGFADRRCRTLSGGQRRRVDIALGLIHRPQVLFLDEPTTGLDPQSRAHLWDEVRRLRAEYGVTVFLTTHYLDEADALCDRLAIIDGGRVVASGSPDGLKREIAGDVVTVGLNGAAPTAARLFDGEPYVRSLETPPGGGLRLFVDAGSAALPHVLRRLDEAGLAPDTVEVHRASLSDVFLSRTGRALRER